MGRDEIISIKIQDLFHLGFHGTLKCNVTMCMAFFPLVHFCQLEMETVELHGNIVRSEFKMRKFSDKHGTVWELD